MKDISGLNGSSEKNAVVISAKVLLELVLNING